MRILIAEDEIATAKALKLILEKNKNTVDMVHNGTDAWNYVSEGTYEVIILDIMMPGLSGMEVLERIRKARIKTPVLMLTAKAEIEDRIAGLEAGADDYLPKPFAMGEFIARVNALGRRSENYTSVVHEVGNLKLDSNRYQMYVGEESEALTNKEYQLLELFVLHPGHVFSTEHLMEKIWGYDSESNIDVVWTHIGYIRKKLRRLKANVEIRNVRGAGYSLEVTEC